MSFATKILWNFNDDWRMIIYKSYPPYSLLWKCELAYPSSSPYDSKPPVGVRTVSSCQNRKFACSKLMVVVVVYSSWFLPCVKAGASLSKLVLFTGWKKLMVVLCCFFKSRDRSIEWFITVISIIIPFFNTVRSRIHHL